MPTPNIPETARNSTVRDLPPQSPTMPQASSSTQSSIINQSNTQGEEDKKTTGSGSAIDSGDRRGGLLEAIRAAGGAAGAGLKSLQVHIER